MEFLKKCLSSNPDASYGRLISLLSFIVFNIYYLLISINPHQIFTVSAYHAQVLQYLFYLILGGYGITATKDALGSGFLTSMFSKVFGSKDKPNDAPAPAPVSDDSGSAKPDQS